MDFPGSLVGKEHTYQCRKHRRPSWIPGSGRAPAGGHGNPLQYSCLENPHGRRSLAGYGPRGRKESDTTARLSTVSTYTCETKIGVMNMPITPQVSMCPFVIAVFFPYSSIFRQPLDCILSVQMFAFLKVLHKWTDMYVMYFL